MAYTYTPQTEEKLNEGRTSSDILPPGTYYGHIVDAKEETSKNGNPMIHLELKVEGRYIHDYIGGWNEWKLKHLMDAVGLDYMHGRVTMDDLCGKRVYVKTRIEKSKDPKYEDKAVVSDYLKADGAAPAAPVEGTTGDKIPF